jgi:signal transduction histidine kinase/ActR/RegA family two-component response regulator
VTSSILLAALPPTGLALSEQHRLAEPALAGPSLALQNPAMPTAPSRADLIGLAEALPASLAWVPALAVGNALARAEERRGLDGTMSWPASAGLDDAEARPVCAAGGLATSDPTLLEAGPPATLVLRPEPVAEGRLLLATLPTGRAVEAAEAGRQTPLRLLGACLLGLTLALPLGHRALMRPVARCSAGPRRLAAGTGRPASGLGALAVELDGMAARQAALEARNAGLAALAERLGTARDSAEAASAAKTRFLRMLSHELRTPLNGILGHAQILQADSGLTPAQRRCAEQVTESGEHLMAMIRELLDLAAIEAGKVALEPAPVRLVTLAESCAALMRPVAAAKGLGLRVEVSPAAGWVSADPVRLRQILLNLLGNAVKFTAAGEVALRIRPGVGGLTRFEVSDTGPGMTEAERASLFQEFLRLAGAGQTEGSGLGLAITARLVGLMQGTIACESAPGQGSLFRVELPLPPVAPGEAGPVPAPPRLGEPLRLLLADDVLVNREVARALLNAAGHEVELVADGAAAVTAALARDWDAVLLDVHMPVMDGLAAARHIRAASGPRGRVPILAVTASANQAEVEECLAAGMDAHVEKPLRIAELQGALAAIRARSLATAP